MERRLRPLIRQALERHGPRDLPALARMVSWPADVVGGELDLMMLDGIVQRTGSARESWRYSLVPGAAEPAERALPPGEPGEPEDEPRPAPAPAAEHRNLRASDDLKARVLSALADGPLRALELQRRTGIVGSMHRTLMALLSEGKVRQAGTSRFSPWELAPRGAPAITAVPASIPSIRAPRRRRITNLPVKIAALKRLSAIVSDDIADLLTDIADDLRKAA